MMHSAPTRPFTTRKSPLIWLPRFTSSMFEMLCVALSCSYIDRTTMFVNTEAPPPLIEPLIPLMVRPLLYLPPTCRVPDQLTTRVGTDDTYWTSTSLTIPPPTWKSMSGMERIYDPRTLESR